VCWLCAHSISQQRCLWLPMLSSALRAPCWECARVRLWQQWRHASVWAMRQVAWRCAHNASALGACYVMNSSSMRACMWVARCSVYGLLGSCACL
jgi:hypothetical protein